MSRTDDMRASAHADGQDISISTTPSVTSSTTPGTGSAAAPGSSAPTSGTTSSAAPSRLIPSPTPDHDTGPIVHQDPLDDRAEDHQGRPAELDDDHAERRRFAATTTRHSWAAQRPYDLRTESDLPDAEPFDPVARAQQRRAALGPPAGHALGRRRRPDRGRRHGAVRRSRCSAPGPWSLPLAVGRRRRLGRSPSWSAAATSPAGSATARRSSSRCCAPPSASSPALGVVAYSFQVLLPRRLVLLAIPLIALLCVVNRHLARKDLHSRRYDGQAMRRTLIVGRADRRPRGRRRPGRGQAPRLRDRRRLRARARPGDRREPRPRRPGRRLRGAAGRRRQRHRQRHRGRRPAQRYPAAPAVLGARADRRRPGRRARAWSRSPAPTSPCGPSAGLSLLLVEPPSARMGRMLLKSIIDRAVGIVHAARRRPGHRRRRRCSSG